MILIRRNTGWEIIERSERNIAEGLSSSVEEILTEVRQIGIQILLSCAPMMQGACACVSGCRWFYKR
jgi:hypothetical protein